MAILRKFTLLLLYISFFTSICYTSLVSQEYQILTNPLDGQNVFYSKGCIKCHSIFGQGGDIGSDLGRTLENKKMLDIVAAMLNHTSDMIENLVKGQVIPNLNSQEMTDILSFLYFLKYFDDPGSVEAGETVFVEKNCIRCHSKGGKGSMETSSQSKMLKHTSPLMMVQEMWNHSPMVLEDLRRAGIRFPTFNGKEIADLVAYLKYISYDPNRDFELIYPGSPIRGEEIFETKGCIRCHAVNPQKESIASNFAKIDFHKGMIEISGEMWNRFPEMQAKMNELNINPPEFSGNEMADIIAFLYFLEFRITDGDSEKGKEIFSEKNCIICHGDSENSERIAPNLALATELLDIITISSHMWNHNPDMQYEMLKRNLPFPRFSGDELRNLLSYVLSMREQRN